MMRILITNDDGINAPGLAVLERIAATISDDIWLCAPETDQSGLAHSLTLNEPLRLREISERRFALKGTPTDCVIMGVRELMPEPPDLILSGVNAGQNISDDVTYSGTVAAAMEGALLGIKSIALSQAYAWDESTKIIPWETVEALAPDTIRQLLAVDFPERSFVNVNFPNCASEKVAGSRVTSQGSYTHGLFMEQRNDGRGRPYYWLRFGREETEQRSGSDVAAMQGNYISITPLKLDLTDETFSEKLKNTIV